MSTYFTAGDLVVYRSHPDAEPEPGIVLRDSITGFVYVDYGRGRVAATRREDLSRENPRLAACIHGPGCDAVSHGLDCNSVYYGGAS